jgi:cysteinyl-tRNA synthetase
MKIYNSLTKRKETFKPIRNNEVGMYVCGPTVYDTPHIGHARAAYIFEVIRSYLEYKGYKVNFVKNITDVDDKIIAKAKRELPNVEINTAVKKVAEKYTKEYYRAMDALGIRRANSTPKATEHIEQIKNYISHLIRKKFAYESEGNVYFDVCKFKDYGKLSHQALDQLRSAVRIEKDEKKKDALDFALWKKAKENEPFWVSPWGAGRPGWHIECSVMSSRYLGDEFDIHGGGRDLIFPHHENEIAQSCSLSGKSFARVWMHNGLLTINKQKMAKSLGNFISVSDFLKENIPQVLKLFFLSSHYRSPIDFNEERIHESKKAYERFQILSAELERILVAKKTENKCSKLNNDISKFKKSFEEAMDDDFNTPQALAILFDLLGYCNKLLANYKSKYWSILQSTSLLLQNCSKIFGIDFKSPAQNELAEGEIEALIAERNELRKKGDFAQADKIRKELEGKSIILEDTNKGTRWRKKL